MGQKYRRMDDRLGGFAPSSGTIFCNSWGKKAILITFCTCSEPFERTKFLTFESQAKNLNCSILLLLQFKSKTRLKSCILG